MAARDEPRDGRVRIDCDTCAVRGVACDDCVVTVLLGEPPQDSPRHHRPLQAHSPMAEAPTAVTLNADELRAIDALAASGLVPPLRLVPRRDEGSVAS